jgi:nitrite reductase/ring-hydroxylating ferredoxin subunit
VSNLRRLVPSSSLLPGGAEPFEAFVRGELRPCIVVRRPSDDGPFAFVNICAHRNQPVVVDGAPFDAQGRIECRAHGAIYEASSGECVAGPCVGARLLLVPIHEHDGVLFAEDDDVVDDSAYAE